MLILQNLKSNVYILMFMTIFSYVNTQKLCSHTGPCTIFADQREELLQKQPEYSKDNISQSNREFLLNQELQDLKRTQQLAQQQAQQISQQQAQEVPQQIPKQQAHQVSQWEAIQQAKRKAQQQALFEAQQLGQQQVQQQVHNQAQETPQQLQNYYNYDPPVAKSISLNILNLAQRLSQHLQRQSLHGEQIFSPISIFSVLQLLLTGANGETYNELNRLLSYHSNMGSPESQVEFGRLIEDLVSDEENPQRLRPNAEWKFSSVHDNDGIGKRKPEKIRLANAVFIQKGISIRPSYKSVIENIYSSQVENMDFNQKDYAEQYINRWVNEKTYGKIPTIIDKNSFDPSTSMIMACAVYFKAFWEKSFISSATMVRDFYPDGTDNPSTKVKVNMMANGGYFPYYEDPNYKIKVIGFPYSKGSSTMYIFQPYDSTRESLRQMQSTLTPEIIEYMISQMKQKNSVFIFPRLHITNSFNLRDTLKSLGLESVFLLNKSDLSLIKEPKPYYSNIDSLHKLTENNKPTSPPILYPKKDVQLASRPMNIIYPSNPSNINLQPLFGSNENPTSNIPTTQRINTDFVFKVNSRIGSDSELDTDRRTTILSRVYDKEITRRIRETPNGYLNYLQSIRNSPELIKPDLYVDNILHKIDLVINEEGTEGAAVTATILKKSGPDVVFRAETPFLILLRHDTTKIPIFYGAIFEPTFN